MRVSAPRLRGEFLRKLHANAHPLTDTLSPGVPLDQIGQTLASFYDNLIAEGVPEHLATLVRRVRQADAAVAAPRDGPSPAETAQPQQSLALVVEDEPDIRELAEALLEETDLDVIGCDSAEAALAVLRERGGDVAMVFADVRLAGAMDGLQLARAVATLWPRARLVITSGHGVRRPELPGEAVFIPKPWRALDVLLEAERATSQPAPPVT